MSYGKNLPTWLSLLLPWASSLISLSLLETKVMAKLPGSQDAVGLPQHFLSMSSYELRTGFPCVIWLHRMQCQISIITPSPGVKTEARVSKTNPGRCSKWQSLDPSSLRSQPPNHCESLVPETMHAQVAALHRLQHLCWGHYTETTTSATLNCLEACLQSLNRPGKLNPEGPYWVKLGFKPKTLFISLGLVPISSHLYIKLKHISKFLKVFQRHNIKKEILRWVYWCMLVVPALEKLGKNDRIFEA